MSLLPQPVFGSPLLVSSLLALAVSSVLLLAAGLVLSAVTRS